MSLLLRGFVFILFLGALFVQPCVGGSPASDSPSREQWHLLEQFHGHVCGGSIFGARLGLAAKEALRAGGGKGKLKARYFDVSCPVDGIQVFAGTTYGNAALTVVDRNEHRLVLTAKDSKHHVEATLTSKALELAKTSRELRKQARKLPEKSEKRRVLERQINEIFDWLQTAPTAEIVSIVSGQGT